MARPVQEINAGSMADIAFLLLIFFLVTTTMDVDSGMIRRLPPYEPPENQQKNEIRERNVFVVLINMYDQLLVENQRGDINLLKEQVKEFLKNPENKPNLSEKSLLSELLAKANAKGDVKEAEKIKKTMELLGDMPVSKGVISLQNDRGTSYEMYIKVQNELSLAINELRNEIAMEKFNTTYSKLIANKEEEKIEALKYVVPMQISEAEPKNIGGKK